jgi:GNAT superfamily N-acetyltransferase
MPLLPAPVIRAAGPDDADTVAALVGELLAEIITTIGVHAFDYDLPESRVRARDWLARGVYWAYVACTPDGTQPLGCITLYESHALYAAGTFGTIPEFYVRPAARSQGVGRALLDQARAHARTHGWKRLEVTTPPLPQYARTLAFYESQGFAVTGGRKMKVLV